MLAIITNYNMYSTRTWYIGTYIHFPRKTKRTSLKVRFKHSRLENFFFFRRIRFYRHSDHACMEPNSAMDGQRTGIRTSSNSPTGAPRIVRCGTSESLEHDVVPHDESFPTLGEALRATISKRGRTSPTTSVPSPGSAVNSVSKKVNNQASPNTVLKSGVHAAASSNLINSHPMATPSTAPSSGRTEFVSAQSNPSPPFLTPASVPVSNDSQATLSSNDGSSVVSRRPGSATLRQVDFAANATQYQYDADESVSVPPNGQQSVRLNQPVVNRNVAPVFPQTPVVVHQQSPNPQAQQIFIPGTGHGVTVLQPASSVFSSPYLHQGQPLMSNLPQSSVPNYPSPFNNQNQSPMLSDPGFLYQQAIQNAFLAGQQAAQGMNMGVSMGMGGEVTVTKDRMIPPAQRIKASLTSVDHASAQKQVRQECYALHNYFYMNIMCIISVYWIFVHMCSS